MITRYLRRGGVRPTWPPQAAVAAAGPAAVAAAGPASAGSAAASATAAPEPAHGWPPARCCRTNRHHLHRFLAM